MFWFRGVLNQNLKPLIFIDASLAYSNRFAANQKQVLLFDYSPMPGIIPVPALFQFQRKIFF